MHSHIHRLAPLLADDLPMPFKIFLICFSCIGFTVALGRANEPLTPEQAEFFEAKIRPVLIEHCYECHSKAAQKVEGGLFLDTRTGIRQGGDSGPSVVPRDVGQSLLINAIAYDDSFYQMPPDGRLPKNVVADFIQWIRLGAPDPRNGEVTQQSKKQIDFELERNFWSLKPITAVSLPQLPTRLSNIQAAHSAIDHFVLPKLDDAGFDPAPRATKQVLLRRATFGLLGLPPSWEDVKRFLVSNQPDAFAREIDRLLAAPQYGERWGRRWLDVARYADSNGLDENLAYANAFRYRDYVIAAFNKDKPYDQFVQEQIAGDLLGETTDSDVLSERLTATGFLSLGAKMLAEDDPIKMRMDIIDEQIDTIGRTFMGLTMGCARCHDHKFDPIPTADYYSLAGIFKSTKTMDTFTVVAQWQERPLADPVVLARQAEQEQNIAAQAQNIAQIIKAAGNELQQLERQHVGDYLLAGAHRLDLDRKLASTPPLGDNPTTDIQGILRIEAEAADRHNVNIDTTSYGKGIGVLVNKGPTPNFAEYDIEVPANGFYQIDVRVASAASRPCQLSINGTTFKTDFAGQVTGGFFPPNQKWFVEGFFPLSKGSNTLRLEQPQFFPHIDKLCLTPVESEAVNGTYKPIDSKFIPKPELIQSWAKYLESIDGNQEALFAPFLSIRNGAPFKQWSTFEKTTLSQILPENLKPTVLEVANAYQTLFATRTPQETSLPRPDPSLTAFVDKILADANGPFGEIEKLEKYFTPETIKNLATTRAQKKELEDSLPSLPTTMAVTDYEQVENVRVHIRGNYLTQGELAPRQFLQVIAGNQQSPIGDDRSGRLELAQWMTSPQHPLTARVIANRIWLGHFGEGLVRTPDNFGRLGEMPTHPELLDWLAQRLIGKKPSGSSWSIKTLHRAIMNSSTYQMSSLWNANAAELDPENRLLWRKQRLRLEAEAIRDSLLAVGDSLETTFGGSLLPTANRAYVTSTANVDPVVYANNRRSIYLPVVRSAIYDFFVAFDFPDASVLNGKRQSTTVAPQALFMMNSKLVEDQTKRLAQQLLDSDAANDRARLQQAYEILFSRSASGDEIEQALAFMTQYEKASNAANPNSPTNRLSAWQSLCRALISTSEFIFVE